MAGFVSLSGRKTFNEHNLNKLFNIIGVGILFTKSNFCCLGFTILLPKYKL